MSGSSRSVARRRGPQASPAIPLVACPDCGLQVKMYMSNTDEHTGWTFYRCKNHGGTCDFWHWEREYVYHLVQTNVLRGEAGVEAVGWAEDRRDALESALGKKKLAEEWGRGGSKSSKQRDDMLLRELLVLGREMILLFKILVALFSCVLLVVVAFMLQK